MTIDSGGMRRGVLALGVALLLLSAAGCHAEKQREDSASAASGPWVEIAQTFNARRRAGDYEAARAMMAEDPRRWYSERAGEGGPWTIGPGSGRWAAWDDEFHSRSETIGWETGERTATRTGREINDYFRLLERGWVTNEIIYYFDPAGAIDGLLIRATGDRPPGRTNEFLAWAREHAPDELAYLRPDGDIDPTGDRARRHRALLVRWRREAGLDAIE